MLPDLSNSGPSALLPGPFSPELALITYTYQITIGGGGINLNREGGYLTNLNREGRGT